MNSVCWRRASEDVSSAMLEMRWTRKCELPPRPGASRDRGPNSRFGSQSLNIGDQWIFCSDSSCCHRFRSFRLTVMGQNVNQRSSIIVGDGIRYASPTRTAAGFVEGETVSDELSAVQYEEAVCSLTLISHSRFL